MVIFPNFTSTEMAGEHVWNTFRWPLREASAMRPNPLPVDYHGLCSSFDLGVATQYAQNSNIPKMVQVIVFVMVVNNVAELGLVSKLFMECIVGYAEAELGPHRVLAEKHRSQAKESPGFVAGEPTYEPCVLEWSCGRLGLKRCPSRIK